MDTVKRLTDMAITARYGQRCTDKAVLIAAYLLPFLGIVDGRLFTVAALIYVPIVAYAFLFDGLYLLYPVLFFFYGQLTLGGVVIFRLYTLAFIFRTALGIAWRLYKREKSEISIPRVALAAFLLLTALRYAIFGGFVRLGAILDLAFLLCFAAESRDNEEGTERFSRFSVAFVFGAIISCAVGAFIGSEGGDGRYLATLNDPNYLGFYINIAVITVFLHPFFRRLWLKLPLLAALYAALIASGSVTGVICNGLVILICVTASALTGRFRLRYLVLPLVCGVAAVQLVFVSQVHEWGLISELSARVIGKLEALFLGDLSGFTTARSALWKINLEKYIGFDAVRGLFGGVPVSAVGRDAALFPQTSHQEFIDALISVGAIGLLIYIALLVLIFLRDAVNLRETVKNEREIVWVRIGIRLIWLFYAFGLTMFLNGRFFVPILA